MQLLLTLTYPNSFHYRGGGVVLPLQLHQESIPQVRAEVDGIAGWFKLDTRYNGSLALFGKFIDEHGLLAKDKPTQTRLGGQTLAGEVGTSPVTQNRVFKLGGLSMQDVAASLFLEKEGGNAAFAGAMTERLPIRAMWYLQFQDHNDNQNSDDAIAERFEPPFFHQSPMRSPNVGKPSPLQGTARFAVFDELQTSPTPLATFTDDSGSGIRLRYQMCQRFICPQLSLELVPEFHSCFFTRAFRQSGY